MRKSLGSYFILFLPVIYFVFHCWFPFCACFQKGLWKIILSVPEPWHGQLELGRVYNKVDTVSFQSNLLTGRNAARKANRLCILVNPGELLAFSGIHQFSYSLTTPLPLFLSHPLRIEDLILPPFFHLLNIDPT